MDHLHRHVSIYLEHLDINRPMFEAEGLGLRPLLLTGKIDPKAIQILSRRYYRLAQWTEILQGDYWLTDPENEVYRYYSLSYKLDDLWYNGAYSLSQAAMNVFESNGHSRTDPVAVNNYGQHYPALLSVRLTLTFSRSCHSRTLSVGEIKGNPRENDQSSSPLGDPLVPIRRERSGPH